MTAYTTHEPIDQSEQQIETILNTGQKLQMLNPPIIKRQPAPGTLKTIQQSSDGKYYLPALKVDQVAQKQKFC